MGVNNFTDYIEILAKQWTEHLEKKKAAANKMHNQWRDSV
jgi:hypothetical protein